MHSFVTEKESQAGTTLEEIRHNWSRQEVEALFALPFNDLLFEAQTMHRRYFDPNQVRSARYFPSKPAPARKIVLTAPKVLGTTRGWRWKS